MLLATNGFAHHTGPVFRVAGEEGYRFRLQLDTHHVNFAGRFHGGMVLTLLSISMGQVAAELAARAAPGSTAPLLSLNSEFVGSVETGAQVIAEVSVTRATRSVLFLSCRLFANETLLTNASAIYKIEAPAAAVDVVESVASERWEPDAADGWTRVQTKDPFGLHVGPLFERGLDEGAHVIRFTVDDHLLDQHGLGSVHDGMLLFMADLFTGRAAVRASDRRMCVTLGVQARRLGEARHGALVDFETHVQLATPSVVFVDGRFHSAGKPLMNVSAAWKVLGAP
ncbi:MAG: hotdog domain-containing protein [Sulfuricaulis sp.]|nr:hotdog domain-containing protein [Sulfuricaulis sp.]